MGGLVAILIAADVFGALRAEGWVGSSPVDPRSNAGSVLLDGYLGARLKSDELSFSGTYNPRLIETPPPEGNGLAAIHGILATLDYRLSRTARVQLTEMGSFGRNDFSLLVAKSTLSTGTLRFIDPRLPTKALLAIADSDTTLGIEQQFDRRLRLHAMVGFNFYGGTDALAQQFIPMQGGPHGALELGWLVTPPDRLSLSVTGSETRFQDGSSTILASVLAGWTHEFSGGRTLGELYMGSGFDQTSGRAAGHAATPFPSVTAAIKHTVPAKHGGVSGRAAVSVSPQLDRTNGDVYELLGASLQLAWTVDRDLQFSASANFGRALSGADQLGSQVVTTEASASYRVADGASLGAGVRTAWQSVPPPSRGVLGQPGVLTQPGFQWATFAGITVSTGGPL